MLIKLFYPAYVKNTLHFGRPQGRTGGDPRFQEGADGRRRNEFTDSAPEPGFSVVDKFFENFAQEWVVGWFEPGLPHAEALNM